MDKRLTGKVAVSTRVGRGIGRAHDAVGSFTLATAYAGIHCGITANRVAPLAVTAQSRAYFFREGLIDRQDQATIDRISPDQNSPLSSSCPPMEQQYQRAAVRRVARVLLV